MRLIIALGLLLAAIEAAAQPVYPGGSPTSSPIYCIYSKAGWGAAGTYEMIPGQPGTRIYICGFNLTAKGSATWQLVKGTGTNCATNQQPQTPPWEINGNAPFFSRSPVAGHFIETGLSICVISTGTNATQWVLFYSQF